MTVSTTRNAANRPILASKIFLYVTEFFSGMAVMAAELGASRLLAPYFSSSQIVWTIIIGTIMIALAVGAVFGGRWADKSPNPDALYMRILVAAVWIALIPLVGKYIIIAISGLLIVTVSTNFLVVAAFASCIVIFVPPLFLLGTVTAGLNKFAMDSLENNASVVGRLSACNTMGSILGTFLPTFVTIPAAGTFVTFLIFSGLLLAIALIYFVSSRVRLVASAVSVVLFVASAIVSPLTGFAFWRTALAYEGESVYNYLQVDDLQDRTILSTNVLFGVQSVTMKTEDATGMYYDTALLAPTLARHADSALILGMGTGTYARELRKFYPNMRIQGVEIDQKITDLAGKWFDMPSDIEVDTYDGRAWLQVSRETYDVIMVDAYRDITIPFSMSTVEFFRDVREHLNPGGVMVVNMNMTDTSDRSINTALSHTIASVFGTDALLQADVPQTTNRELFAVRLDDGDSGESNELQQGASGQQLLTWARGNAYAQTLQRTENSQFASRVEQVAYQLSPVEISPNDVSATTFAQRRAHLVMTDDWSPVELLGMHAIDGIIEQEAQPYRDLLRTEGIDGLLKTVQ